MMGEGAAHAFEEHKKAWLRSASEKTLSDGTLHVTDTHNCLVCKQLRPNRQLLS